MLKLCLPQDSYIDITEDRLAAFKHNLSKNLFTGPDLFLATAQYIIKPFPVSVESEEETYCVWMNSNSRYYSRPAIKLVLGTVSMYEILGTTVLYIRQNIWKNFQGFLFTLPSSGCLTLSCNAEKFLLQASYSFDDKTIEKDFYYIS